MQHTISRRGLKQQFATSSTENLQRRLCAFAYTAEIVQQWRKENLMDFMPKDARPRSVRLLGLGICVGKDKDMQI